MDINMRLITNEREKLILENEKLVYYVTNSLIENRNDFEDLSSIGKIGLIKAAMTFDSSKGIKFSSYAVRCIRNEILDSFRKEKRRINYCSLDDVINADSEGKELTIADIAPSSEEDFLEKIEKRETCEKIISIILNLLPKKERRIILYKIAGFSHRDIAKIFDCSRSYITFLIKGARKKIETYFATKGEFKQVFKMEITDDLYKISFSSKDVENFDKIFCRLLRNLKFDKDLPSFKVDCGEEQVVIYVPADPESFILIAQLIQEIDNFSMTYVSEKIKHLRD